MSRPSNSRHHLKVLAVAAAAAAANAGSQASAAAVGIHFQYLYNGGVGYGINTAGPQVFAGVPAAKWNNMAPIDYFGSSPISYAGQSLTSPGATGISVDYSAANSYAPYGAATDDNAAYMSYLDDSGSGYSVTIHGLSTLFGGGYSITALQATNDAYDDTGFANVLIYAGVGKAGTLLATLSDGNPLPIDASGDGIYGDTNASSLLTADTITIVGAPRNGDIRSTLAGLAIQSVPEPSTLPLLGAGVAILLRRRRK